MIQIEIDTNGGYVVNTSGNTRGRGLSTNGDKYKVAQKGGRARVCVNTWGHMGPTM